MSQAIGHMRYDLYKQIFKEVIPYSIKLNWRGEPLLHKQIVDMIKFAKRKGVIEVLLNTNGLLLTPELITKLATSGLDWLIVSVDGVKPETYAKIRTGGNFEQLVRNLFNVKTTFEGYENKPKVRIQICKQPANEKEIEEWKDYFAWFADDLRVGNLYDPQGKYGYKLKQPKTCSSPWQRLMISWNGNICLCPGDFTEQVGLGNIADTSIYEAWHSRRFNVIRNILRSRGRWSVVPCDKCTSYC